MSAEQQYIDFYREAAGVISQRSLPVMNAAREAAFRSFCAQGFPSRKVERYKYTDVQADFAPNYGISLAPLQVADMPYAAPCTGRCPCGSLLWPGGRWGRQCGGTQYHARR